MVVVVEDGIWWKWMEGHFSWPFLDSRNQIATGVEEWECEWGDGRRRSRELYVTFL